MVQSLTRCQKSGRSAHWTVSDSYQVALTAYSTCRRQALPIPCIHHSSTSASAGRDRTTYHDRESPESTLATKTQCPN
jgi:hypothetical protein